MLDVVLYHHQPASPSEHLKMFAEGLRRHGITPEFRRESMYRKSDLAVMWAHKKATVIRNQRESGLNYLVMERGYFGDRFAMTSLGFNGLNGYANFHNERSSSSRWEKHRVAVKEWKTGGDIIVLMGQVPTDASLKTCSNYSQWVGIAGLIAQQRYQLPVYFRPHPHPAASAFRPRLPILQGTLEAALDRAAAVLTWNSNSGVDAVLNGVPLIAVDRGSMAYSMAVNQIGDPLIRPDRTQWLHNLAYTQWTNSEISQGESWEHLRQHFASIATAA